ncbi:MAG: ROK family protein, partial [Bacteroidetes bacterium]|nr:ROK family protein [Bacteroidota bacterium]
MLIGIDIGGTSSKLGLVDQGKVVQELKLPTKGHASADAFADALAEAAWQLTTDNGQPATAIGIGA